GLRQLSAKQAAGHKSYLLGHVRQTGWWYFFPVALGVKTPIAFLLLIGVGLYCSIRSSVVDQNWVIAAPAISALALLLVCIGSRVDIGIRHLLPIYPLLAIIGGVGAWRLWQNKSPRFLGPAVMVLLLSWQVYSSFRAHPDY